MEFDLKFDSDLDDNQRLIEALLEIGTLLEIENNNDGQATAGNYISELEKFLLKLSKNSIKPKLEKPETNLS